MICWIALDMLRRWHRSRLLGELLQVVARAERAAVAGQHDRAASRRRRSRRCSASCRSSSSAPQMAFSRSGRSSVTIATASRRSSLDVAHGGSLSIQRVLSRCAENASNGTMVRVGARADAFAHRPLVERACGLGPARLRASRSAASARISMRSYGPGPSQHDAEHARSPVRQRRDREPHRAREDVHAAHVEHVVGAAGMRNRHARAAAGPGSVPVTVTTSRRAVAHERLALACAGACRPARRSMPSAIGRRCERLPGR